MIQRMSYMNFYGADVKGVFHSYFFEPIDVVTFGTLWWHQTQVSSTQFMRLKCQPLTLNCKPPQVPPLRNYVPAIRPTWILLKTTKHTVQRFPFQVVRLIHTNLFQELFSAIKLVHFMIQDCSFSHSERCSLFKANVSFLQ